MVLKWKLPKTISIQYFSRLLGFTISSLKVWINSRIYLNFSASNSRLHSLLNILLKFFLEIFTANSIGTILIHGYRLLFKWSKSKCHHFSQMCRFNWQSQKLSILNSAYLISECFVCFASSRSFNYWRCNNWILIAAFYAQSKTIFFEIKNPFRFFSSSIFFC